MCQGSQKRILVSVNSLLLLTLNVSSRLWQIKFNSKSQRDQTLSKVLKRAF